MPAYRFEAANIQGKIESGVLEADSPRHARALLRTRNLTPLTVDDVSNQTTSTQSKNSKEQTGNSSAKRSSSFGKKLSNLERTLMTRQFASLLSAGLPLEQVLNVLIEQAERDYVRDCMAGVRTEVLAGHSLAEAMAQQPKDFPEIYRALIAAGEQSGELSRVMERLADYLESRQALGQKMMLAFIYPAILTLVAFLVIIALVTYVVPQVVASFAQSKQALPFITVALIKISDFVRNYGIWLAGLGILAIIGWRRLLKIPAFRLRFHQKLLKLPILKKLLLGFDTARFSSTLAILVGSSVPLLRALQAGAETMSNLVLKNAVEAAVDRVREGVSLARALNEQKCFPPILVHLIASGEATGQLPHMLERTAQLQSNEVERRAMTLTSMLEPLLILTMGGVVLIIVLAVMLPIIQMNNLVK